MEKNTWRLGALAALLAACSGGSGATTPVPDPAGWSGLWLGEASGPGNPPTMDVELRITGTLETGYLGTLLVDGSPSLLYGFEVHSTLEEEGYLTIEGADRGVDVVLDLVRVVPDHSSGTLTIAPGLPSTLSTYASLARQQP